MAGTCLPDNRRRIPRFGAHQLQGPAPGNLHVHQLPVPLHGAHHPHVHVAVQQQLLELLRFGNVASHTTAPDLDAAAVRMQGHALQDHVENIVLYHLGLYLREMWEIGKGPTSPETIFGA